MAAAPGCVQVQAGQPPTKLFVQKAPFFPFISPPFFFFSPEADSLIGLKGRYRGPSSIRGARFGGSPAKTRSGWLCGHPEPWAG